VKVETAFADEAQPRTAAPVVRKDEAGQVINGTFREVSGPVILPPIPPRKGGALATMLEAIEKFDAMMQGKTKPAAQWSSCAVY